MRSRSYPPCKPDALRRLTKATYTLLPDKSLADHLEHIARQPETSPEARSVLTKTVIELRASDLKLERLAAELKQSTEALLEQMPCQGKGGAA
jgi:hypothetical protein